MASILGTEEERRESALRCARVGLLQPPSFWQHGRRQTLRSALVLIAHGAPGRPLPEGIEPLSADAMRQLAADALAMDDDLDAAWNELGGSAHGL